VTYEGERNVMGLQTARFLLKAAGEGAGQNGGGDGDGGLGSEFIPNANRNPSIPDAFRASSSGTASSSGPFASLRDYVQVMQQKAGYILAQCIAAKSQPGGPLQTDLLAAAEAHCKVLCGRAFSTALKRLPAEDGTRGVFEELARVFCTYDIIQSGAWSWPPGYWTAGAQQAIAKEHWRALNAVRPHLVALTDSFGYTDQDLKDSRIGRYDGNVYEALLKFAEQSELNKPSLINYIHENHLKGVLDQEYLASAKTKQRSLPLEGSLGSKL